VSTGGGLRLTACCTVPADNGPNPPDNVPSGGVRDATYITLLRSARVKKAESGQIVIARRDRGFVVEYLLAPDECRGFARPVNNMVMMMASERFLAERLGAAISRAARRRLSRA
jgi:hypothetical protein